jgi:hypothetical protein
MVFRASSRADIIGHARPDGGDAFVLAAASRALVARLKLSLRGRHENFS